MNVDIDAELSGEFPASGGRRTVEVILNPHTKIHSTTRHVVLVVDTSSSMNWPEEKIERARLGVDKVLDELDDEDYVSILSFDSHVTEVVPFQQWGSSNKPAVRESVTGSGASDYDGDLVAGGGTDIKRALQRARKQFDRSVGDGRTNKDIILLSDGKDSTELDEYTEVASDIGDDDITIVAGGIGTAYNEDVMLTLGRESGGESYNLKDPNSIDTFLEERIQESSDVIAPNPKARIDVADGFRIEADEPVVFSADEPQAQSRIIRETDEGGEFGLPRLTLGKRQRFSFVVLGMPRETNRNYPLLDLFVENGGDVLAQTFVKASYAGETKQRVDIEKRRKSAKITCDIIDPEIDKKTVDDEIEQLRKIGWGDAADELKRRQDGNKIDASKPSKARLDDED